MSAVGSGLLVCLLVASVALFIFEGWRLRGKGFVTVLEEFRMEPNSPGECVYIKARAAGLLGALLHAFGWERASVLSVTDREIALDRVGLSGFRSQYIPLDRVASSECQFYRALSFLALAFLTLGAGLFLFLLSLGSASDDYIRQTAFRETSPVLVASALIAGIFYLIYRFSRRVVLSVETFGGARIGMSYKRSIIAGTPIELEQAVNVVRLLNSLIAQQPDFMRTVEGGR